ncbi:flagellar export chaperone FliS [Desulfovulcanus sp.]
MQSAARAYLQTKVNTTTQEELVVLLFEAAIKFLQQAKEKIKENDFAEKGILISKALDIISELDASLNPEKGGEIAKNLHSLYFYCQTRLLIANLKLDCGIIDEVIDILKKIGSAFAEIIQKNKLARP